MHINNAISNTPKRDCGVSNKQANQMHDREIKTTDFRSLTQAGIITKWKTYLDAARQKNSTAFWSPANSTINSHKFAL